MTAAAIQKSEPEKILDRLNWVHNALRYSIALNR
jgi:hypothetical protein